MAQKNKIFSGKPPRKPNLSYDEWWSNYLANKPQRTEQEAAVKRKRSARAKIQYANRLASATTDVLYNGKTYSPEANRMRYLMQQFDKGERDRLRRGIYDDSKTQRAVAEKMLEGDLTKEEIDAIKKEAEDIYHQTNIDLAKKLGPPKRKIDLSKKPPKPKI